MTTNIFDTLSHTDFLRLTLEAFSRQGYKVEPSRNTGADGVLVGKNGGRIAVLCKKYRGAFIGRPVLQQFYEAMGQSACGEGYLITTTDCSPDAYEYAKGKGISLYNRDRTTELLKAAFGEAFIRSGMMPELGPRAAVVPAAARKAVSVATYEKVPVPDLKTVRALEPPPSPIKSTVQQQPPVTVKAPEPAQPPVSVTAPEPVQPPEPEKTSMPELAVAPEPEITTAPSQAPEPVQPPAPLDVLEPVQQTEPAAASELAAAPEQAEAPEEPIVLEDLPEEVLSVESIETPAAPEAPSPENTTTIACAECNHQLRVPTDQGMITVTCTECGSRWLYQPEMNSSGEVKTTTIITCTSCSQQLNVPTNRGPLNVRCPKCGEKWLFTP